MKNVSILVSLCLALIIALNVFSFVNINQRFISFLNSSLEQQTTLCGNYMETQIENFENDLNRLLYDYHFSDIFKDKQEMEISKQSLQVFYSKYRALITNIFIFDNKKNYFGIYVNERDQFVIDTFARQRQQDLSPRDKVAEVDGKYLYHYPYFKNDKVSGNIIVEVDFQRFAKTIFSFFPVGRTISYQWVLNADGEILSAAFPGSYEISAIDVIADSIEIFSTGLIKHELTDAEGTKQVVHSAYYPLTIFNQNLGIVFSKSQAEFNQFFINQNKLVSAITFFITFGLIVFLLFNNFRRASLLEKKKASENALQQIINDFPVGIMVLDEKGSIHNINNAARQMLHLDKKEKLIGKEYKKLVRLSGKYMLNEEENILDDSDYLYFEHDGNESVISRIETPVRIGNRDLQLIALIDVSVIERSRKQEVAANKAKSDFLASLSHEITTPMNEILEMIGEIMESSLSGKVEEKIRSIRKSSSLLMTIINDILDFSKIEAGRLMLEEIPFRLREEIYYIVNLYRQSAEEKDLLIDTNISPSVPDKLIGDPFRLRQVISNLVNNAIKYTVKGKIEIGVEVMEEHKGNIQLLFWIEDTGIGIPKDKIGTIFRSYGRSGDSRNDKGGAGLGTTISKQLIELMNGEIWVESPSRISSEADAPGSRFSFTVSVFSNEKLQKNYDLGNSEQLSQITVLVLTRESMPEKLNINKILHQFGLNVITKIYQDSTVDTVLHHLHSKKNFYQMVVVSDKDSKNGFAIAERLKKEGLTDLFPCVIASSNDQPGSYKMAKKLGIDYYLIEPFESMEIYDILNESFPAVKDLKSILPTLSALPDSLNILLVEDNVINQKVVQSVFKHLGYEIELANNGAEAISIIKKKTYDLIFMDLFMPEMDGFETARHLRKQGIKTPIIAMSADKDDERKADSVLAGMDDFLAKPVKVEDIKKLLNKLFSSLVK
ncbi:MAG: response regulator [Bacteroidales bacterium]|nr:response regulator [Bacteroidales bacterium]